jgi:hypothetical protein
MGYQSFGSKTSAKHNGAKEVSMFSLCKDKQKTGFMHATMNVNQPGSYTNRSGVGAHGVQRDLTQTMQSSIQEFLDETRSIEEDLRKLKQLSVEKSRGRGEDSDRLYPRTVSRFKTKLANAVRDPRSLFRLDSRGRQNKTCRTADNSLERGVIESHFQLPQAHNGFSNGSCKFWFYIVLTYLRYLCDSKR